MAFSRSDLRDELDAIFDDADDKFWNSTQKNQAINYGIDRLWPELKLSKVVNDVTLAEDTYIYESSGASDLTEYGFSFCELEVTDAPYRSLGKKVVSQRPDPSKSGGWAIHVKKSIVGVNVDKKLKLWYHARHPRLATDGAEIDIPSSEPIIHYAAMILCVEFAPKRGHTEIRRFLALIPQWEKLWLKAKQESLTLSMPSMIGIQG